MNKTESIKQQKIAGTYYRNKAIVRDVGAGVGQVVVARKYDLTPARISQIVNRQEPSRFIRFIHFLGDIIKSLIEGDRK